MTIPTLTSPRLTLRPFTLADINPLHQLLNADDLLRYFPNPAPPPRDRVERMLTHQLQHWAEYQRGWWAVEPRAEPGLIGWAGLELLLETGETEVAYLLSRRWWGQGLATEAAQAALRYGFETLRLESIIALVHPDNLGSRRVAEKAGLAFVDRRTYFGMELCRYRVAPRAG